MSSLRLKPTLLNSFTRRYSKMVELVRGNNSGPSYMTQMFHVVDIVQPKKAVSNEVCQSARLMLNHGLISRSSIGIFHIHPMLQRSLDHLCKLVDGHMANAGGVKMTLSHLTESALWKLSGRWDDMGRELVRLRDRRGGEYCLAPTQEEAVTQLAVTGARLSRCQLPLKLYQISWKFRDEIAPKYGLLRSKEFLMKDMYSFDRDMESALVTFRSMNDVYSRLFSGLGVPCYASAADGWSMGGTESTEFLLPTPIGEDALLTCDRCHLSCNAGQEPKPTCAVERTSMDRCRFAMRRNAIEVGHTFLLGERYTSLFEDSGSRSEEGGRNLVMGCYGIGITRLLAAIVEVNMSGDDILWPPALAPFTIVVVPPKAGSKERSMGDASLGLARTLASRVPGGVLFDDRLKLTIGRRLVDTRRLGIPYAIVLGRKAFSSGISESFELMNIRSNESRLVEISELISILSADGLL